MLLERVLILVVFAVILNLVSATLVFSDCITDAMASTGLQRVRWENDVLAGRLPLRPRRIPFAGVAGVTESPNWSIFDQNGLNKHRHGLALLTAEASTLIPRPFSRA
jgi:hypothetical protein